MNKDELCEKIVIATPRCLCGATVSNCIVTACKSALSGDSNAKITLDQWRKACVIQSPYCTNMREKREGCDIMFDYNLIKKHNQK